MPKPPNESDKKPRKKSIRAPAAETTGYEKTDLSFKAVALSAGALLLILIVTVLGIGFPFAYRTSQHQLSESVSQPVVPGLNPTRLFPEPRLQYNEYADMRALRAREEKWLGSYRWVDSTRGLVAIPIERAMDLTAARGLPVRKEAANGKH
jgi:hypothetical protein